MRIVIVWTLGLASALFASSPAFAGFGFCMTKIAGKDTPIPNQWNTTYPSYLSEILDFGAQNELESVASKQFVASVGQTGTADCFTHFEDVKAAVYGKSSLKEKQAGYHIETGWTGGFAARGNSKAKSVSSGAALGPNEVSISFGGTKTKATVERPVPDKYVEVQGPNGPMRLSPEVAARNQAAAEEYRRKMEEHEGIKAEHARKLASHEQSKAAAAAQRREHERQKAAHAAEVAANQAAQLEYRKLAAKPTGVNAVYRGFPGPTCEIARRSAIYGSSTNRGTRFAEVTQDLSRMPQVCIVQGWWWNTSRTGSLRQ